MKYIVKHTYIATEKHPYVETGAKQVWYIGKGGQHAQDIREFTQLHICEGWCSKHFAEKHIEADKAFDKEHGNDAWESEWEIIAY